MKIKICNSGFYQFNFLLYREGDKLVIDCTPHKYRNTKKISRGESTIIETDEVMK